MPRQLTDEEISRLQPAELCPHRTPVPTQMVSSDEYYPSPQNSRQREVEARLLSMADDLGGKHGLNRRRFFQTASGMAAAFVAMNEVYGTLFGVDKAEAASLDVAEARAAGLRKQFIMDMHTHFLRDDIDLTSTNERFTAMRAAVGKAGWNKQVGEKEQTPADLKFENFRKEIFFDSDTKIALISSAPADDENNMFLTNKQMIAARDRVNREAGSKRLFAHQIFMPGSPGWLEQLQEGLKDKPDSMKGYTIGDYRAGRGLHPWRMDDEKTTYKGYELMVKAGVKNVCVHKGLFTIGAERNAPNMKGYADVGDVGRAAKDWPELNFIIYHSGYRHVGDDPKVAVEEFHRTGRLSWASDLADIPEQFGVNNVYGDLGQIVAMTLVAEPNICAALMGILIKGLGSDRIVWGTDALWTGAPQWQIEGFRRLEIPEDMQKKFGYAPLGAADGPVKSAIFGDNNARLYNVDKTAAITAYERDNYSVKKLAYLKNGEGPSNLRYGYVNPARLGSPVEDYSVFA